MKVPPPLISDIGPYHIIEMLGEGGMGVVFMAEQTQPVRRRVALKVIKPGMDSAQVIARFEAERQALALMDHPNIARVLDAGTDRRRPALLRDGAGQGRPDHRLLRRHTLTPRRTAGAVRAGLPGVQHAHQKGIIHRDLKPSNVLVAVHDGNAGAEGHRLRRGQGDRAAADRARRCSPSSGSCVGTPEYMSPEQAEMTDARHRHAQRRLLAGRAAVRAAGRSPAFRAEISAARGAR